MCVIIDTNVFGDVFEKESKNHDDFEPICRWISEGFGRIVYGGSKYKSELNQATKYLKLFKHYNDARRIIKLSDEKVDEIEKMISKELEEEMISKRTKEMTSFIVMDVLEKAGEMERNGIHIIHLEVGEPDFDTPECIKKAACKALDDGHTHYTHSLGLIELREAIFTLSKSGKESRTIL